MSYYEGSNQWGGAGQNNWDHQTPNAVRSGNTGPQPQDEFAFFYQFDEVDRAHENLAKSGKTYGLPPRFPRAPGGHMAGPRMSDFNEGRSHASGNVPNFYTNQRNNQSRGSNEAEQVMQMKRRMAAQRERELRNLHTEQQYQRTALNDVPYNNKSMTEEETRELIARQRSALYKEGPFAEKGGYVDETGAIRSGVPGPSGPSSLRGASPLAYELARNAPPPVGDAATPVSNKDAAQDQGPRPHSTNSPQPNAIGSASKTVFDGSVAQPAARTTSSSPGGSPPRGDITAGSKAGQLTTTVAPIGTRPSGTPVNTSSAKRSTTPLASPGGWGRGGWPQSSGLGGQTSVWA